VALYLAKKSALKGTNQKGGAEKDGANRGIAKPLLIGKKVKKGGTPVKETKPLKVC
jgi:hypothetical protein